VRECGISAGKDQSDVLTSSRTGPLPQGLSSYNAIALQTLQTPRQIIPQLLQQLLVPLSRRWGVAAQTVQLRQLHWQTGAQGFGQTRPQRWLAEDTGFAKGCQALAHLSNMLRAGLHFAADGENASMLQPVRLFEVIE